MNMILVSLIKLGFKVSFTPSKIYIGGVVCHVVTGYDELITKAHANDCETALKRALEESRDPGLMKLYSGV